jgi:hypothetical protein
MGVKSNTNDRVTIAVVALRPLPAGGTLWTGGHLNSPIEDKAGYVESSALLGLPALVSWDGADHFNLMFILAPDQCCRIHITGVQQVLSRQQFLRYQSRVNLRYH